MNCEATGRLTRAVLLYVMNDDNAILDAIRQDPDYLWNLDWGEPRSGHPEGSIRAHIEELEGNLARLAGRVTAAEAARLRLLIHTHDSFKPDAKDGVPISDPRSHASLARQFLAKFCDPANDSHADLLNMTQYHDEPYALYQKFRSKGMCDPKRFETLLSAIRDWNLFAAFLMIDGCTKGKSRGPLQWFLPELGRRIPVTWDVADLAIFE